MYRFFVGRLAAIACAGVLLAGCAGSNVTTRNTPPTYYTGLQLYHVSGVTLKRVQKGRVLRYVDLEYMLKCGVPSRHILDYVKATRQRYELTPAELNRLANLGASPALLAYLRNGPQTQGAKMDYQHPYFWMENYWGPAPFQFQMPQWGWVVM